MSTPWDRTTTIQEPWLEQLEVQNLAEQSSPPKPAWHKHMPLAPQVPRVEQPFGQSTPEQSAPRRPRTHRQKASPHTPYGAEQSVGHSRWQATPRALTELKPASQRQKPSTQVPWAPQACRSLLQSEGTHARRSQASPCQPGSQTHVPEGWHVPYRPHCVVAEHTGPPKVRSVIALTATSRNGAARPQPSPKKPSAHAQVTPPSPPTTQRPWPRLAQQPSGQPIDSAQSSPRHPPAHWQETPMQCPWDEQALGHLDTSHDEPAQPLKHSHAPSTQRPWSLHPSAQLRTSQRMPVQPASHSHAPRTQWPCAPQPAAHPSRRSHATPT